MALDSTVFMQSSHFICAASLPEYFAWQLELKGAGDKTCLLAVCVSRVETGFRSVWH